MATVDDPFAARALRFSVLAVLLLALLIGMGAVKDGCPSANCVAADYDTYVGTNVTVTGYVVETGPHRLTVPAGNGSFVLTVHRLPGTLDEGDRVRVYGTLGVDRTMVAHEFVVHRGPNLRYMYAVSLLGLFVALGAVARSWRFEPETRSFVPRGDE